MPLEYSKCKKTCTRLLLLWALGLSNWGNPTLTTAETATEASHTLPKPQQEFTPNASNTLDLTAAQQQWLEGELQKSNSQKKQFKKMLAHINAPESFIRLAAYQRLCQLLKDHPKLANKKALQYIKKIVKKIGVRDNTQEALLLLNTLVNTNPKLALPTAKIVVHLTKASQQPTTDGAVDVSQKALSSLIPAVVQASPNCIPYLIKQIHQHTRVATGHHITSSSGITVSALNVAEQLLSIDTVYNNSQYFNQVLEIVLDGASLHNVVWGSYSFKNPKIQVHAQTLLKEIIQQYPTEVQSKLDTLTKQARRETSDAVALTYLTAFAAVDHQHIAPLLVLFNDILKATNTRIQTLVDTQYREKMASNMHENAIKGPINLVSSTLVNATFKGTEKKLIEDNVRWRDDRDMRVPLLRLLLEITTYNKSYLTEALTIIRKTLDEDDKSDVVRTEALDMLAHIVRQDNAHRQEAMSVVSRHTQVQSAGVRQAALRLLEAILKAGKQHTSDATALDSLNKFRQDKNPEIRQKAEELFSIICF